MALERKGLWATMETFWDWLTVFAFAGLVTLFLQRSTEEEPTDKLWQYLPPAAGCALVNYLGNDGRHMMAAILFAGVLAFIVVVLKVRLPSMRK